MKTLKIYNMIAVIIIFGLTGYCYFLQKELSKTETKLLQTEAVLDQCESRYFEMVK